MREHAIGTAEAFSAMKPEYIGLLTLMVEHGTPLERWVREGEFTLLSPVEVLKETELFLQNVDSEGTVFRANHASNYLTLKGTLNGDRDALLGQIGAALAALVLTLPLWLIPPLVLILPPLIWGWLTYRVMSFDALADYASADERRAILKSHRWPLLAIGVLCGYMGAAPAVVWASGVLFAALFVVLVPLAIWIYTFVFVFSSLWFAHYCLDALVQLRAVQPVPPPAPPPAGALPPADARTSITDVPWRDANRSS